MEHKLYRRIWAGILLAALLIQPTGILPVYSREVVLPLGTKNQPYSPDPTSEGAVTLPVSPAAVTLTRSSTAQVKNFIYRNHSSLDLYDGMYRYPNDAIEKVECTGGQGGYGGNSPITNVIDNNYSTHWESSAAGVHHVLFTFKEPIEIARIVYAMKQPASPAKPKGFPTKFEIYGSETDIASLALVAEGGNPQTYDAIEISLPATRFKYLKFVWKSTVDDTSKPVINGGWANASEFRFYKEDSLEGELKALFTNDALVSLVPGVTLNTISPLESKTKSHPFADGLWHYIEKAYTLLSLPSPELVPNAFSSIWSLENYTADAMAVYNSKYLVDPEKNAVVTDGNNNPATFSYDGDWDNLWTAPADNTATYFNSLTFRFQEIETIGRIIFKGQPNKNGFPAKYKIFGSNADSGENFKLVAQGSMGAVTNKMELSIPNHDFKRLRFVWDVSSSKRPTASEMAFYKEDTLMMDFQALFTDKSCTALVNGVTMAKVKELTTLADMHPFPDIFQPYIQAATALLGASGEDSKLREKMTLSQRGDSKKEWDRVRICYQLGQFDLTGYYALPGETLGVYVDADPKGPMPHIVLATANQFSGNWAFGLGGKPLSNGYNEIKAPANMKGCQLIYFYNPAIPADQAFAPVVRLVGGTEYPVYRYNSKNPEQSEDPAAFLSRLAAYEKEVTDIDADAEAGRGKYNVCELTSDKIIITTSARGAIKGLKESHKWEVGVGQGNGRTYSGAKDLMELYDIMYDDIMLYSGFNITDPEHIDYKPYSQFMLRAYSNGVGGAWAQNIFTGFNTGNREHNDLDKWENSYYVTLASVKTALIPGWAQYHEIGHMFDCKIIDFSESTNNLYALAAQDKYMVENRLAFASENRWNRQTVFINTGFRPSGDTFFYPLAAIYQLEAVDFSATSLYEPGMSNYGRASRYARRNEAQLLSLSQNDRMIVALSMGAGVDLSDHFGFYEVPVSEEARWMLRALPKEPRPTWFVNDRTFLGSSFNAALKNTAPTFTAIANMEDGSITLNMDQNVYLDTANSDKNLQCFAIYRQDITDPSAPDPAQPEFIGITGDDKSTPNLNDLYIFKDRNVRPNKTYKYLVSAYDCTLVESAKSETTVTVPSDIEIPVQLLNINNNGNKTCSFNMGTRFPVRAVYYPDNATIDLDTIVWEINGNSGGAGENSIRLEDDPDFPGDPTRKRIVGLQAGVTNLKLKLGKLSTSLKVTVKGTTANLTELTLAPEQLALPKGDSFTLKEIRYPDYNTTTTLATWTTSDPTVATVAQDGTVTAMASGTATIKATVPVGKLDIIGDCAITVTDNAIPATDFKIQPWTASGVTNPNLYVGEEVKLTADPTPTNATNIIDLIWNIESQTPDTLGKTVLNLDSTGNLKAISPGKAVIKATVGTMSKTIMVTVGGKIPISYVTINENAHTFTAPSETLQLSLTASPANASGLGNVVWKTGNKAIATVDQAGLVKPVSAGQTVITGSINGKYAACTITVDYFIPLDYVKFQGNLPNSDINVSIVEGKGYQLVMMPNPIRATNLNNIIWESSNETVATVNPLTGFVNGVVPGSAVIKGTLVQTLPDSTTKSLSLSCNVTVTANAIPLVGVSINTVSHSMKEGDVLVLNLFKRPTNANTGVTNVTWVSSDSGVASVNGSGQVTAISTGSAIITGKMGAFDIACNVIVQPKVTDTLTSLTMVAQEYYLDYNNTSSIIGLTSDPPEMAANVFWSSADSGIAKVDQLGVVTAVSTGETTITAALSGKWASCKVIVDLTPLDPTIKPVTVDLSQLYLPNKDYDGSPVNLSGNAAGSYTDSGNTIPYTGGFTYTWINSDGTVLYDAPVNSGLYAIKASVDQPGFIGSASKYFQIFKRKQPIAVGLVSVQATNEANNNAKITGLDPRKLYEYRVGDSEIWKEIPANSTELTGLIPESYYIRLAGDMNTDPSKEVCIIIAPYHPEIPALLVNFTAAAADGLDVPKTTSSLTLSFDNELDGFNKDLVTLQGASKKGLTRLSPTDWKLSISNITVASGEAVTVRLADPTGYEIVPSSRKALVYNETAPTAPDTGNGSSSSGSANPEKEEEVKPKEEPKKETQEDNKNEAQKPPKKKPVAVIPANGKESTTAKLDKKGNATLTVSNKAIDDAIANARSKAKKNGTEKYGISVEINISAPSSAKTTQVNLPKSVQDKLIAAKVTDFILTANKVSLTFDLAAIKHIRVTAKRDVNVNITQVSANKVPPKAKKTIGNNPVYDFTVTYGSKKISSLGKGKVNIGLPYKPKVNEKKGNLVAAYIGGKGKVTPLRNSSYNKNLGIVLFSTNHFSTYSVLYVADNTSSIFLNSNKHWAKDALNFAESRKLFEKTGGKMISPDAPITRGTLAVALGKMAKIDPNKYKDTTLTDVKGQSHHIPYMEWAVAEGIIKSTSSSAFSPNKAVTREEMADIMVNYCNAIGYTPVTVYHEVPYNDNHMIREEYADSVREMQMTGIMMDKYTYCFVPQGKLSYAELSSLLNRFTELKIDSNTAYGWHLNDSGAKVCF